jgi:hypothetical protein
MQIKLPSVDWGWDSWTSSMLKKKKFLRKWKVVRLKYELKEEQENSRRHLRWPDRFLFVCHSTVSSVCMEEDSSSRSSEQWLDQVQGREGKRVKLVLKVFKARFGLMECNRMERGGIKWSVIGWSGMQ